MIDSGSSWLFWPVLAHLGSLWHIMFHFISLLLDLTYFHSLWLISINFSLSWLILVVWIIVVHGYVAHCGSLWLFVFHSVSFWNVFPH